MSYGFVFEVDLLTSRLKSTPPIGDPKATEIPDAAAADSTSLFRAEGNS